MTAFDQSLLLFGGILAVLVAASLAGFILGRRPGPPDPTIENLNRILPKGEVLPVPMIASVTFGAALQLEPGEACAPFLARARAALLELRR